MLAAGNPCITVETVGVQSGNDQSLIVETCVASAERTEHFDTVFMPGGRKESRFAFRTGSPEEVDRLVLLVGQADRDDQVAGADIEGRVDKTCDVELLHLVGLHPQRLIVHQNDHLGNAHG